MTDTSGYFALAGIFLAAIPQIFIEKYKQHLERCAVAQAYIGEISSILDMTKSRDYVSLFTQAQNTAASGTLVPRSYFDIGEQREDKHPVFENYIKKLGLLKGTLPRDIAQFYAQLKGIRIDLIRLAEGSAFQSAENQARILDEDLKLWAKTEKLGQDIVQALTCQTEAAFVSFRCWFYMIGFLSTCYLLWQFWLNIRQTLFPDL